MADLQTTYPDWVRKPIYAYSANAQSPRVNAQTQTLEIVAYSGERKFPHRRPVDMKSEGIWYPADVGEPHRNILTTDLCPDTREGSLCCTFVLFQGQIYRELATKMAPGHLDKEGVLCRHSKPYIFTDDRELPPPPGIIMQLGNYRCSNRRCGCSKKIRLYKIVRHWRDRLGEGPGFLWLSSAYIRSVPLGQVDLLVSPLVTPEIQH